MHSWKMKDDVLAYYLNEYGTEGLKTNSYNNLAEMIGTTESSLKARIQNVRNVLDNNVGLSNAANQTKSVVTFLESVKNNSKVPKDFKEYLGKFLNESL